MESMIDFADGHTLMSARVEGQGEGKYDFIAGKDNFRVKFSKSKILKSEVLRSKVCVEYVVECNYECQRDME